MTHVLIMSVGPVQEFIAGGRKCRDLWFGSWLLSDAAVEAAKAIEEHSGVGTLVFPGELADGRDTGAANKIVARVDDPLSAARAAEKAVQTHVIKLAMAAFARVGRGDPARSRRFFEATAMQQVEDLLECLWAYAKEDAGADGYKNAREEAERLLAARKNTKQWGQPSWAMSGVPKSSLDGVRESVLDESLFDEPRNDAKPAPLSEEAVRRLYGVHGAERLCGIGVLKRFGRRLGAGTGDDEPERVFSTSHVAALPFLDGLAQVSGGKRHFERLVEELEAIQPNGKDIASRLDVVPGGGHVVSDRYDGAILFPGRLLEIVDEAVHRDRRKAAREAASKALAAFLKQCGHGEPSPYFAVLLADGDHMGKVIDKLATAAQHRELSKALEGFASGARDIVRRAGGSMIYAGGDDVLAFLPLHRALSCAKRLADDFARRLGPFGFREGNQGFAPTLSTGLALVHALVPLDESLEEARAAERAAKEVKGKDALAVRVVKRGGETVGIAGRRTVLSEHLDRFVQWHRDGDISSKAQYALMDLARLSAGDGGDGMEALVRGEATRIIDRRRASGGATATAEAHAGVHAAIHDLGGPAEVGRALYVAQLIARAMDQADPPKPTTLESTK